MTKRFLKLFGILIILFIIGIIIYKYSEYQKELSRQPLPTTLHPLVAKKKDILIDQASEKGITILITDGFRTVEEQDALYARGRNNDAAIVTNAKGGESYHNYGLAIDFAIKLDNGSVIWDLEYDGNENGQSDWLEVVAIAKELGFSWGGDWDHFTDNPHLQMDFGLSIRDLQKGHRPDTE
ncbi:hypothetical protein GCM10011351_28770 [Paraliobacillus quinghaiensis]|uniref:Peptidase M15C domain-containing protein n=1 Tax=Paraliobacillus quinghaiensis TaxID=470815 RepID=A0A917TWJ6_9BACI|nr:M15 family metallopeptidase [Paraliobacillus quinghaiensis]GGM40802.1 hypothetical protein GCM10011351_28770 [Paraliobacillus quinghaiensis]